MASTQVSPGVVVLERDLTNTINATIDNVAAIVGAFEKGPVEEVVTVSSERELLDIFGKPNDYNYEYWFSVAQFLLYGGSVKVVRADSTALKNSIDAVTFTDTTFSATDTTLTVTSATDFDVNDYLKIDAEIIKVTAISGLDITVLRGQLSTAAVSHSASTQVALIEEAGTQSTINEGATFNDSDVTLTVTSAASLGVQNNSYIIVDSEILQVTSISTNDLTVTRGVLGTTAAAHTDGTTVKLLTVTTSKTTINEQTSSGLTPPLIKNLTQYESNVETGANQWKWAGRSPGIYGNSLRVVMTDAGPDQVLNLAGPTSGAEWEFTTGLDVNVSATNTYSQVFNYSLVVTLTAGSSLIGEFEADNFITANSGNVTGRVVAYDKNLRKIELVIDDTSADYLEVGDTITELANSAGSPGSATGDQAEVSNIVRRLEVAHNEGSTDFVVNQSIGDDNAASVQITSVEEEYVTRYYGPNQKWGSVAGRPGTSDYARQRGGYNDLMHVLVLDGDGGITGVPGSVLEKFLDVSKARDAKSPQGANIYYKDVIKLNSNYLFWGSHEASTVFDVNTGATGDIGGEAANRKFDLLKNNYAILSSDDPAGANPQAIPLLYTKNSATLKYSLRGGVDGYTVARDKLFDSYDLFSDPETEEVDYILQGPSMSNFTDSVAKAQKMLDIAAIRKDCMAFVSPPRDRVIGVPSTNEIVDRVIEFFKVLSSTSYGVFDNNYKYVYDKYSDKYRYLPCNPDVAGLTLSCALNQEPWFSPAGFARGQVRNAIKLAYSPLKDHRDRLYSARVNPIVAFPGQGNVLFGDKTSLGLASAFDRINVRRLFLVIEKAIATAAKSQLFELNDEFTRTGFKNIVDPYLRGVQARRGVVDYLVVCDSSNNPPDAIDRGEFFAEIFVKPTRSINFITLQFTATRTGASFAEIVG